MNNKNKLKNKNNSGFTLIEMVIVTVFVSVTFIAIYQLFASTVKQDTESRYEIIASNLAQEGVEMIRNMRDDNEVQGAAIKDGISNTCNPTFAQNPACSSNTAICLDANHYYSCPSASKNTPFTRTCNAISNSNGFLITCTVSWASFTNPNLPRSVTARSLVTDWWE